MRAPGRRRRIGKEQILKYFTFSLPTTEMGGDDRWRNINLNGLEAGDRDGSYLKQERKKNNGTVTNKLTVI